MVGGVVVCDDPAVGGDVAVGALHHAVQRPSLSLGRRRVGVTVAAQEGWAKRWILGCVNRALEVNESLDAGSRNLGLIDHRLRERASNSQ